MLLFCSPARADLDFSQWQHNPLEMVPRMCSLCCLHTGPVFKPNTSAYSDRPAQGRTHSFSPAGVSRTCSLSLWGQHCCVRKPLRKKWGSLNPPRPQTGVYLILIHVLMGQAFPPTGSIGLQDSPGTDPSADLSAPPRPYKSPRTAVKVQLLFRISQFTILAQFYR